MRKFFLGILLFYAGVIALHAEEVFVVQGIIEKREYAREGKVWRTTEREFSAWVGDCKWLIWTRSTGRHVVKLPEGVRTNVLQNSGRRSPFTSPVDPLKDYVNYTGCDGTNTYALALADDNQRVLEGFIWAGVYPYNDAVSMMGPVWLAYGSACFFKTNQVNPRLKPFWDLTGKNNLLLTEYRVASALTMGKGFVPAELSFLNEGTNYTRVSKEPTVSVLEPRTIEGLYADGYTQAVYSVKTWTNAGAREIPLEFEMTMYRPDRNASSPQIIPVLSASYRMTNAFATNTVLTGVPDMRGSKPTVFDFRYALTNTEAYAWHVANDSRWPVMNAPEMIERSKTRANYALQAIKADAQARNAPNRRKAMALILISAIAIAPLVFIVQREIRRWRLRVGRAAEPPAEST